MPHQESNSTENMNTTTHDEENNNCTSLLQFLEETNEKYRSKLCQLKKLEETSLMKVQKAYKTIVVSENNSACQHRPASGLVKSRDEVTEKCNNIHPTYGNGSGTFDLKNSNIFSNNPQDVIVNNFFEDKYMVQPNMNNTESCLSVLSVDPQSIKKDGTEKKEINKTDDVSIYNHLFSKFTSRYSPGSIRKEMWQKQITVPEPFSLSHSVRHKEIVSNVDFDNVDSNRTVMYSNPVPASSKLPLYELMTIDCEATRKQRIEERKQKLAATVQPFNFSCTTKKDFKTLATSPVTDRKVFKTAEVPKFLFDQKSQKDLNEALQKIRIKSRAEEMLKLSSYPFSGKLAKRKWKSTGFLADTNSFKSNSAMKMAPNKSFEKLKQKYLRTLIVRQKHVSDDDAENDNFQHTNNIHENEHKNVPLSKRLQLANPSTVKQCEIKSTKSVLLRQQKLRETVEKNIRNTEQELLKETMRSDKKKLYHAELGWKFTLNDNLLYNNENIKEKLRSLSALVFLLVSVCLDY